MIVYLQWKNELAKGTEAFPSSFIMTQEEQIQQIESMVNALLVDDIFLVSIRIKPTNNIKIFLDADSGLSIDKCIRINRALYRQLEEMGTYPDGNFSLEVSSPGVDEPLKLLRQYKKNTGRNVEVLMNDEVKQEGKLLEVTDDSITIEQTEGKGKKLLVKQTVLPFANIKHTIVLIKF